jgi:hypothetical protein
MHTPSFIRRINHIWLLKSCEVENLFKSFNIMATNYNLLQNSDDT